MGYCKEKEKIIALVAESSQTYFDMMRERLLHPEGKVERKNPKDLPDLPEDEPKCDCGTEATYKNPTLKMHSTWCELRKNEC